MARKLCEQSGKPQMVNEQYKLLKKAYKLGKKQI